VTYFVHYRRARSHYAVIVTTQLTALQTARLVESLEAAGCHCWIEEAQPKARTAAA
jgi:hypothetical protein